MKSRNWLLAGVALFCVSAARPESRATGTAGKMATDDLVEIQQLYARYNWLIDSGDCEGWASTFTADGTFNASVGHDAIAKFCTTFRAGLGGHARHWNTNLMILPSTEGATGQVYLVLVDFATKPPSIAASGTYADELVKTAQGWQFKKRRTKADVAPTAPASP